MLSLGSAKLRLCEGLSRREFLRVGGLTVAGLSMADLAMYRALQAQTAAGGTRQKNCIFLFLIGAPSQLDTFDLKPEAPAEIRGPFNPISTNVPGIQLCEHFPLLASMADKFALIRSMYHRAAPIHETGHQMMQSGWLFRGGIEYPSVGSVLAYLAGGQRSADDGTSPLPPYVVVPDPIGNTGVSVSHGQDAGYLGKQYDPFYLNADPAAPDFRVMDLAPPSGIDPARLRSRRELLDAVDVAQRRFEASEEARGRDSAYEEAFGLIFSDEAKQAFDIAAEPDELRDRYGRNTFGQGCLLARRLVERGVRLVTVNMFDTVFNEITWDCHADGGSLAVTLDDYKETLCPMFELAFTGLIQDLESRGMLQDTLVIAGGEFGRTFRLNARGGRDHWPNVWSILAAGGGVRGGQVIGASDPNGAEPLDRPVHPSEIVASIYHSLGIDLDLHLPGPQGRPTPLVEAQPVRELFG